MDTNVPISHILVPCTNRKRWQFGDPVSYRNCEPGSPTDWINLLSKRESPVKPAKEIYCGGSWQEIIKSKKLAPNSKFLIASAGYGLIELETPISSYQATFQSGSPDSVGRLWRPQTEANRKWWEAINGTDWYLELAESRGIVLLQLSSIYLNALMPGLQKLADLIGDKLVIISPGYLNNRSFLGDHFLPIDVRFEQIAKCARSQLGASALRWVLTEYPASEGWDISMIKESIRKFSASLPNPKKYNRITLSDNDVLKFIENHHNQLVNPSATSLLRILRDSNYACEQSRFSRLFREWQRSQKV